MIEKRLHQIWVGTKPIPQREAQWCHRMEILNPKWTYRLHGNELLVRYKDDPFIKVMQERQISLAFITDRLRVLILRDEGGVYLDADCEPRPLDSLSIWDEPKVDFVAGLRNPHRNNVALHRAIPLVDNTFLGSAKGGKMINRLAALWSPAHIIIDGHTMGCAILEGATYPETAFLNHRYIYAMEKFPETLVLHDAANLGSWAAPKNFLQNATV